MYWVPQKGPAFDQQQNKAISLIFKISFVSNRCDINLDFDILSLKIGQILAELQELEDQTMKAVSFFIMAAT